LKDIQNRLRKFYESEVERFELDQQRLAGEAQVKAYDEASKRLRREFEAYAAQRMPIFSELTLIAGFPDPNPTSKQPEDKLSPVLQQRFDRAVQLRKQLAAIDDQFQATVQQILGGVRDLSAAELAAMRLRVEQFKEELDRKADAEAKAQVRQTASEMGLKLLDPLNLTLPGIPTKTVTVPGEAKLEPAPTLPARNTEQDRERLMRHQLSIWLGLNRYSLTERPGGGADKTGEFLKWREKFEVGP
jgi:hypothetical protein